jgi:hypothetical protein
VPRKPSRTIRVDEQTHIDLQQLSARYRASSGRYHSLADMVRIGLTLAIIDHERKEYARGRHRASAGGDEGVLPF